MSMTISIKWSCKDGHEHSTEWEAQQCVLLRDAVDLLKQTEGIDPWLPEEYIAWHGARFEIVDRFASMKNVSAFYNAVFNAYKAELEKSAGELFPIIPPTFIQVNQLSMLAASVADRCAAQQRRAAELPSSAEAGAQADDSQNSKSAIG